MHGRNALILVLTLAVLRTPDLAADSDPTPLSQRRQFRRPVALATMGSDLYVANGRSGSISLIDATRFEVRGEWKAADHLSDLASLPGTTTLLALDDRRHELLVLNASKDSVRVEQRIKVANFPERICVSDEGRWLAIASLWSRRLTIIEVKQPPDDGAISFSVSHVIDLEFAPREMAAFRSSDLQRSETTSTPSDDLLVADAFGGQLALFDIATGRRVNTTSIAGHNLRGVAVESAARAAERQHASLLISHQVLNSDTSTTHEHVFWGGVIGNRLRSLDVKDLMTTNRRDPAPGSVDVLGRPSAAAGDPSGVAVTSGGATIVALSGINEVAVRRRREDIFTEIAVGRRPTRVALLVGEKQAAIANTLDDTISIVDLQRLRVTATVSLGPTPEPTATDRGEQLFFDSRLSLDGWYSCHSCHTDGHTNGLLNDNLGDEYFGAPKKILTLLGTAETSPWAWNGGSPSLEAQVKKSLLVTMQSEEENASEENIAAIKSYLLTLSPPPGIDAARDVVDPAAVRRGMVQFREQGCVDCHAPATYTTPGRFDVGIHDERGMKEFNPPSLRGVSQRAPYFHDNRAATLNDVLDRFRHGLKGEISPEQRQELLAFLRSI